MILDTQNTFCTALSVARAVGDAVSTDVYDTGELPSIHDEMSDDELKEARDEYEAAAIEIAEITIHANSN